jgi:hypothetical protein
MPLGLARVCWQWDSHSRPLDTVLGTCCSDESPGPVGLPVGPTCSSSSSSRPAPWHLIHHHRRASSCRSTFLGVPWAHHLHAAPGGRNKPHGRLHTVPVVSACCCPTCAASRGVRRGGEGTRSGQSVQAKRGRVAAPPPPRQQPSCCAGPPS